MIMGITDSKKPIYVVMVMEKSGTDTIKYDNGKDSGFPDVGEVDYPGFYYDYEDALYAMHNNTCDIREGIYNYGFILKHFPGMYCNSAEKGSRVYFEWDQNLQGYYEVSEPNLLELLSF